MFIRLATGDILFDGIETYEKQRSFQFCRIQSRQIGDQLYLPIEILCPTVIILQIGQVLK